MAYACPVVPDDLALGTASPATMMQPVGAPERAKESSASSSPPPCGTC
jgi:hypothetical protein